MTTDNKYIHNVETDEIIVEALTKKEQTERIAEIAIWSNIKAEAEAKAKTKAIAKAELLNKLGITADEAQLLIG